MKHPLVSVIVPSYNSAATLDRCLAGIKGQTYLNIEIIVVDRNSTDNTRKIASKYTTKVFIHGPERAAQVNFGVGKAIGKYLYRVDSDFIVDPMVVEECVDACQRIHWDGIAIHNTSAEGLGFWADVRKLERNTYIDDDLIVAVRFFTKKSWTAIGGFDETLYGPEDYDFHNRFVEAGYRWGRITAIERHLGEPKSLGEIWRKHFFYGKHMVSYYRKHPTTALKQFNPLRLSYLRHIDTLFLHPVATCGLICMTLIKFTSGGLGFIVASLSHDDPDSGASLSRRVVRLYAHAGWVSVFARIRFWTGSFTQIASHVPDRGSILDLGCGYGIFANYLALASVLRKVIGVDLDKHKLAYAFRGLKNTSFRWGDATTMRMHGLSAVLLLDVLHHLNSYRDQERLISASMGMIRKNGKLIIVEVDSSPWWKLVFARITDGLLYVGQPVYYRYRSDMVRLLTKHFGAVHVRVYTMAYNPYPHVLYVCQKT